MNDRLATISTEDSDALRPPARIQVLAFLVLVSSGIVLFEPAPTDLLFLVLVGVVVLTRSSLRFAGIGLAVVTGLALFGYGNGLSMMAADRTGHCMRYLAITGYMVAIFVVFAGLIGRFGPRFAHSALRAFCVAALVTAIVGILARFRAIPQPELFFLDESGLRIRSTFKDANVLGPFLVAGTVLVLNDYLTKRRSLLSASLFGVAYVVTILFAFSRGAFLHLAISLAIYGAVCLFIIRSPQISRRLLAGAVAVGGAAILALSYALAFSGLEDFLQDRLAVQSYDSERFRMQELTLHVAANNPLGIGPGEWDSSRFENDPHNVFLRVLAENGLVGVIGWLIWCGACLARAMAGVMRRGAEAPTYAACLAILGGVFAESLFIDSLHWRHMFFIAAVPVGLHIAEAHGLVRANQQESAARPSALSRMTPRTTN